MKKLKLVEIRGYIYVASYWDKYDLTDEEYEKIASGKYLTSIVSGVFVFQDNPEYSVREKANEIEEFKQAYELVSNITFKIQISEANEKNNNCTSDMKALAALQTTDLEEKLLAAETIRDSLLTAWVAKYTDGSDAERLALVKEFNNVLI